MHRGSVGISNDGNKNGRCACVDVPGIQFEQEKQARLLELLLGVQLPIAHAKCSMECGPLLAISDLRPHEPRLLSVIGGIFILGKCRSVCIACPLFGIRRLSAIWV